jgi:diacylglycerol kinase family enzyme
VTLAAVNAPTDDGPLSAVVINPSKVIDLEDRRRRICDALAEAGWPEPMWLETTPEDPGCGQARQAVEGGAQVVFACGGDGTVMACLSELVDTDVALAVLPAGTGNLLAANLDLPDDPAAGVALAVAGGRQRIDVGVVGERTFVVMAGMGFDAHMVGDAPEPLKASIGWPAYAVSAMRHLWDRPMRVRVRLDSEKRLNRRVRSVLVANVGRLQAGVRLLPDAEPDDGLFDVALLMPRHLGHWLSLAWAVLLRHERIPAMKTYRARHVEIVSDRPQPRQLDGDVIEPDRRLTVDIRPRALLLCVAQPAESPDLTVEDADRAAQSAAA